MPRRQAGQTIPPPTAPAGNPTPGTKAAGQPGPSSGVPAWTGDMPAGYKDPVKAPQLPPSQAPVFPDAAFAPIAQPTNFGVQGQHYNPTTAPYGFDMSTPGVGEQFWNNNQQLWLDSPSLDWADSQLQNFQDPWAGEQFATDMLSAIGGNGAGQQYWNGVGGSSNMMGATPQYTATNNAQTAFDDMRGKMPGDMTPKFDAYYDRMKDKVMSDVNSQSAARGTYGSNTALNNTIGAGLDVEAQRAKASTDFDFANSDNQRAWGASLSGAGRSADISGLGIFGANLDARQFDVNKAKVLSEIAFGVDESKANRLGAGISTAFGSDDRHRGRLNDASDAAGGAQDAREGRINGLEDNVSNFSNDAVDFLTENYDAILGGDQQMSDAEIDTMLAKAADERGWDQQTTARIRADVKDVMDMALGKKNAGEAGK